MKPKRKIAESQQTNLVAEPKRVPGWVMPVVKGGIILVDACIAFACFASAFYLREGGSIFSDGPAVWSKEFASYAGVALFVLPIRVLTLGYAGVLELSGAFSYITEFIKVFKGVLIGSLFIIAFTFLYRGGFAYHDFSYSRGVFALDFALAIVAFTVFHLGLRYGQAFVRQRDINLIPTLIVGTNKEAQQTIKELRMRPTLGYRIVGIIDTSPAHDGREINDLAAEGNAAKDFPRIIGNLDDLSEIISKLEIQEVIITDDEIQSERLFETMLRSGRKQKVEFRLVPKLFNFLPQKTTVEQLGVLPMVKLFRDPISDSGRFLKRISDIVISAVTITLLAPLWLLISLFIKVDSRGSVFFKQERVGMDGRKFICYKFRTMMSDADELLHRKAYQQNIAGFSGANAGDRDRPVFGKVKNDPRVTKIGKILRRSSLDEIPQLLNVLLSDMSIVGPRPPIPYEVEEYDIWHRKRLDIKPGITGLWQVSGRNRLTFEEMVRIDLYYIENWSLWLDLKIILLTLPAILRGDGEK